MADETETPETKPDSKPAPRRRAPRKTAAAAPSEPKKTTRSRAKSASTEAAATQAPPSKAKRTSAPAKPRASKRSTPAPKKRAAPKSTAEKATEKVGGKWSVAAVVGGIAAAGAATAALLSLRGSTPKADALKATEPPKLPDATAKAHQPDGTDSSKSFEAGIADENTIPEA